MTLQSLQDIDIVYTPEEVGKKLKVAGATIRNLIKKGELFAYQIGDQFRIPRYALSRWLFSEDEEVWQQAQANDILKELGPVSKEETKWIKKSLKKKTVKPEGDKASPA